MQSQEQTGERPSALRAKKWGFGLIRKALDFPEVVTMELRSELKLEGWKEYLKEAERQG